MTVLAILAQSDLSRFFLYSTDHTLSIKVLLVHLLISFWSGVYGTVGSHWILVFLNQAWDFLLLYSPLLSDQKRLTFWPACRWIPVVNSWNFCKALDFSFIK